MRKKDIDFSAIEKALASLKAAIEPPPVNDRERDGAIQRFEYTFELAWKVAKKVLEAHGIASTSPKSIIRDMAEQQWIADAEKWFDFLDARNRTSHTYAEKTAEAVYYAARNFYPECKALIEKLKSVLES